jgi:hypothetical protein
MKLSIEGHDLARVRYNLREYFSIRVTNAVAKRLILLSVSLQQELLLYKKQDKVGAFDTAGREYLSDALIEFLFGNRVPDVKDDALPESGNRFTWPLFCSSKEYDLYFWMEFYKAVKAKGLKHQYLESVK